MKNLYILLFTLLLLVSAPILAQDTGAAPAATQDAPAEQDIAADEALGAGLNPAVTRATRAEQEFFMDMIPSHAVAVDSSILVFQTTTDPTLRHIAERTYKSALGENERFKLKYAQRFGRIPATPELPAAMRSILLDIDRADATVRDRKYAEGMIALHRQAISVSQQLLTESGADIEARLWAQVMVREHSQLVQDLQTWLTQQPRS